MRAFLTLATIFLFVSIIMSCGRDHDDEENPPQPPPIRDTIPTTDTIPSTDSLPPGDTTGPVTDSLPDGWHRAATPSARLVSDVFFADNTTGYAITDSGGVWKSTDGGLTWVENSAQLAPGSQPANLAVTADDKVFVLDNLLRRSVSGSSFGTIPLSRRALNTDVYFVSNDTGYVSGGVIEATNQYCLWKTTNGGASWNVTGVQPAPYPNAGFGVYEFSFSPGGNGYQAYGAKVLYKKRGDTVWKPSTPLVPAPVTAINSISAPVGNIAYLVTRDGAVYKTEDAGENFAKVGAIGPGVSGYLNLHFTDGSTGYCTVNKGLYKTTDGGVSWQLALRSKNDLIEVHFTDADHGWVCGLGGTILTYHP